MPDGCHGVVVGRHEQGRAADEGCKGNTSPGRITTHGNRPFPKASARIMAESPEGVKTRRELVLVGGDRAARSPGHVVSDFLEDV